MPITQAKWIRDLDGGQPKTLEVEIDGETFFVPADPGNRHYVEILAAQANGEITIEDADPEPEPDLYPSLTPRQFEWMLAYYDLENVWNAVKTGNKPTQQNPGNRKVYANIRANEKAQFYVLNDTLAFLAQVRDLPQIANSGLDLSDEAIRYAWRHATVQTFESMVDAVPHPDDPAPE